MKLISTKGIYGVLALYELALHYNKHHIQIKYISDKHDIPQHFLEQLLLILKKSGIVKSYRGKNGGYSLAIRPDKIILLEVLTILDGAIELSNKDENILEFFWDSLKREIGEMLDISIEQIMQMKNRLDRRINYVI